MSGDTNTVYRYKSKLHLANWTHLGALRMLVKT